VGDRLNGIATNGPIARTVADAAALLDVMSGYVTGDPYWLPNPEPCFLTATNLQVGKLRVAFATALAPLGEADAACQQAVQKTVQLLEQLGHSVEPDCPDLSDLIEPFTAVWQSGVAASGIPKEALEPMNQWLLERSLTAGQYLQAVAQMQVIARRIVAFFDTYDVLVLPTYMHQIIRVGEWANLRPEETLQKVIQWAAPCPPFNASGQPVIAIPTGLDQRGLPVGVQLVGKPAAESTLIALASQLEAAKLWTQQRPPMGAE
jgi:amidase